MNVDPSAMTIAALIAGLGSAYLAHKRGRNPLLWFAIGTLFGIFGVFALFFAPTQKKKPAAPVWVIDGPKDKFWYYVDPNRATQGPISHDALTLAWKEGKITPATFVWHEDLTDWKLLKDTLKTFP
jgi:hypothetical protein